MWPFQPIFGLFLACCDPGIKVWTSLRVFLSQSWRDGVSLAKKIWVTKIFWVKVQILTIFAHFWPGFGLLWLWYQKLSMKILVLIMTGLSLNNKKKLNNNDFLDEVADFGPFSPTLACFWPIVAPVSISKALNEYSWPNCDKIEWGDWKNCNLQRFFRWKCRFWSFLAYF